MRDRSQPSARALDLGSEGGFALVEVLVSAVLLLVIAMGVFKGLDAAQSSTTKSKARTIAGALAEQDQERMRGVSAVDLSTYARTLTVPVNGVPYTVTSQSEWIRDATGGTESCTSNATQADFLRITSTVTSDVIGTTTKPVTQSSIVAPPVGAFTAKQGTLSVPVRDRNDDPVVGMPVTISGPKALTVPTNAVGCAIFAYIPTGAYTATVNQTTWVGKTQTQSTSVGATVAAGKVTVAPIVSYDRAAPTTVTFVTTLGTQTVPSKAWSVTAGHPDLQSPVRTAHNATPQASIDIPGPALFPFPTAYSFWSGRCDGAQPPVLAAPGYFATYPGSKIAQQGQPLAVTVRQPPLKGVVVDKATNAAIKDAVIVLTPDTSGCTDKLTLTTDAAGLITKPYTAPAKADPGVPYGTYDLCVSVGRKRLVNPPANVDVTGVAGADVGTLKLDLTVGNSASGCT
ncbi:MAG: hypothetical protein QOF04_2360 [Solirubrobacteraceae bacterium]|jgi:Tfp pilus assembly protein PilV|nr:hypothetical protein [Solirubrobacteraceae bacterium]